MSDEFITGSEFIAESLKALRRADLHVKTGPEAEIRTLLAFRRQQRRRRAQRTAVWSALAAAMVAAISLWPARQTDPQTVAVVTPQEAPIAIAAAPAAPTAKRTRPRPAESNEIATGFYPLMESPPPLERAVLVRVTVTGSAMRSVGLPVGDDHLSDPVLADVLVGQDDLARAIRFVSYRN